MAEFFHMGGYAVYVWSAYGIWLAVMIINVVQPIMKARGALRRLARTLDSEGAKS